MSAKSGKALVDTLDLIGDPLMGAGSPVAGGQSMGQGAKAHRRKSAKAVDPGMPLVPLSFARDNRFSDLLELIEPRRRRDELVLSPQNIRTFVGLLEEYRHGDTLRHHGLTIRSKLLFCGPPGCGKTVTAEVFAGELGLPMLVARLDGIISSFLGETATNLRKVFESVQRQPVVLFLDEFDALARSRSDGTEHSELRRVVNSLLMMIDQFRGRGFLIAATNLEESLDVAVWRRFDEVILFDPPRESQIRQLLAIKTRNFPAAFSLESKITKLRGLSYADIERVCLNAIKRSILRKSRQVLETEFDLAAREERQRQQVRSRLKSKSA